MVWFGIMMDIYDVVGEVVVEVMFEGVMIDVICKVMVDFCGMLLQMFFVFFVKKVGGCKFYELVCKGEMVELDLVEVEVFEFDVILEFVDDCFDFCFSCFFGIYVWSLVYEVGVKFGCGVYLCVLRCIQIGLFEVVLVVLVDVFDEED